MLPLRDIKDLICIKCKIPIPKLMTMSHARDGQLHKGQIVICSACGKSQILGDTTWRPMTRADYEALPKVSQDAFAMALKTVLVKLQRGEEFNPHDLLRGN